MRIRTRITAEARARGWTAAEVARRLGWYRSNISAMDAGRRAISLQGLARVSQLLNCGPGDLLETDEGTPRPVFGLPELNRRLIERERCGCDVREKGWVHAVQLGWLRHYGRRRREA